MGILEQVLSAGQENQLKKYREEVAYINALEHDFKYKSDQELIAYHNELLEKGHSIANDSIRPKDFRMCAFAFFREWTRRQISMRAHDVQLIAAMALDDGHVAEAATGEGKSLVSHFATYLNNLCGMQCHVVSVNEYLTQRDADEARHLYEPLGLSVGNIFNQQEPASKQAAYECDVVYGTPSEFGFDYLRDNMVSRLNKKVQTRGHQFALIDEADSVLIDEARTPLIISGPQPMDSNLFHTFASLVPSFREGVDYIKQEEKKSIAPTEEGIAKAEQAIGVNNLYDDAGTARMLPNYLHNALKAQFLFQRDKDYIVEDDEVKIVDEFTGRIMAGRRWSDGLHQAIEAKEDVEIQAENKTIATITLQNYFRLYDKLAGMTGTAMTEDAEFRDTYNMDVIQIPPNKPSQRIDEADRLYRTSAAKFQAIVDRIEECHASGQPVLVGTVSVESSEHLSQLLSKRGIEHEVLNAKNHAREAEIISQAGRVGAVTIATNMAGRGTDIKLGGNPEELSRQLLRERFADPSETDAAVSCTVDQIRECREEAKEICAEEHDRVVELGGLMVIGSERHESRRIDNQLRGRAGRQGDPGRSCFYLSLDDNLVRLFGDDKAHRASEILHRSGWDDSEPLINKTFTNAVESAQRTVEAINYQRRKDVLQYDDVINKQRLAVYKERDSVLSGSNLDDKLRHIIENTAKDAVTQFCNVDTAPDDWDWKSLRAWFENLTGVDAGNIGALRPNPNWDIEDVANDIADTLENLLEKRRDALGKSFMRKLEHQTMLAAIDKSWMQHIADMDYLKQGIGLRAYSQRDPLTEYKQDAYDMFGSFVDEIYRDYLRLLFRVSKVSSEARRIRQNEEGHNLDITTTVHVPSTSSHASGTSTRGKHAKAIRDTIRERNEASLIRGKHVKVASGTTRESNEASLIRGKHAKAGDNTTLVHDASNPYRGKHAKPAEKRLF